MNIDISIIIPIYNSELFLEKCINSIINQNHRNCELILINDGSIDSSLNICQKYAQMHSNIKICNIPNSGPSKARNLGIRMAKGKYIAFVDSDDFVDQKYFSTIIKYCMKEDFDILCFGIAHHKKNSIIYKTYKYCTFEANKQIINNISDYYNKADLHSPVNKVFKRDFIISNNVLFPEGSSVEEDLLFNLEAVDKAERMIIIPDILYHYNCRLTGSITTSYNPEKFQLKKEAFIKELGYVNKWNSIEFKNDIFNNYISYISSTINNLFYLECKYTKKQKLKFIKDYFTDDITQACFKECNFRGIRNKVMKILIRFKLIRLSYFIHKIALYVLR